MMNASREKKTEEVCAVFRLSRYSLLTSHSLTLPLFALTFFFAGAASVWNTILLSFTSTSTTTPSLNFPPSNSTESGLSTYFWMARAQWARTEGGVKAFLGEPDCGRHRSIAW